MTSTENPCREISLDPKRYINYYVNNNIESELYTQISKELQKAIDEDIFNQLVGKTKKRKQISPSSRVGHGLTERLNAI